MTIIIGILGGIGSGKSAVGTMFEKLGAFLIDADLLAHAALLEPEIIEQVRTAWGDKVLSEGAVDRRKLAAQAFSSREQIERLNAIVHPRVIERVTHSIDLASQAGKAVVLDAALLLEAGLGDICTTLVFVHAETEVRLERALAGRGLSADDLRQREKFQIALDKKRSMAHHVIDNNKSEAFTSQQVSEIWDGLFSSRTELST
ncbi:dephospho-CoA kinase [Planctomycetota bacterium]